MDRELFLDFNNFGRGLIEKCSISYSFLFEMKLPLYLSIRHIGAILPLMKMNYRAGSKKNMSAR